MASTAASTLTPQLLIDYARTFDWTAPTVGVAGYSDEPALSFCQDIVQKIMAKANPWKWNSNKFTAFNTNPLQQDYPTSISQNSMGWLENCTQLDVNSTAAVPARPPVRCVHMLLPTFRTGITQNICWIPNNIGVYGSWPGVSTTYTDPLVANGGGTNNNPNAAILDDNSNIQQVTTYGTTGTVKPTWPAASAAAGVTTTDGTVVWTVQDPNGVAIRLDNVPSKGSQVWQLQAIYQAKPPVMSTLGTLFTPIPDDLNYLIKQGFLAYCYKKSDKAQFQIELAQWHEAIQEAMTGSDREDQEFGMYPTTPIQGGGSGCAGNHGYPGWSSRS